MKITMQKIANDLGVSKMTISRYFNGGSVSEPTRLLIEEYVEKNQYSPNFFASNLKKKSNIIGFVTARVHSRTSSEIVEGILKATEERNLRVLLYSTNFNPEREREAINELLSLNALGIIVVAANPGLDNGLYAQSNKIYLLGRENGINPAIVYPELDAIKEVSTLINKKQIKDLVYISSRNTLSHRLETFKRVMQDYNDIAISYVTNTDIATIEFKRGQLIFCSTDEYALTVYRHLKNFDLEIGKDIFIIGVGGYPTNDLINPSLSSIIFPYEQVGYQAVENICDDNNNIQFSSYEVEYNDSFK